MKKRKVSDIMQQISHKIMLFLISGGQDFGHHFGSPGWYQILHFDQFRNACPNETWIKARIQKMKCLTQKLIT